jgi:hypothetical protein
VYSWPATASTPGDWWRTDDNRTVRLLGGRLGMRLKDGASVVGRGIRYPVITKSLGGMPFSALYTRLAEALEFSRIWVFIGYAFGDQSLVELVDDLWTPDKRLIVVGPHASQLPISPQVAKMGDAATVVNASFGKPGLIDRIYEELNRKPVTV